MITGLNGIHQLALNSNTAMSWHLDCAFRQIDQFDSENLLPLRIISRPERLPQVVIASANTHTRHRQNYLFILAYHLAAVGGLSHSETNDIQD